MEVLDVLRCLKGEHFRSERLAGCLPTSRCDDILSIWARWQHLQNWFCKRGNA
jgi:hypothetical protein